MSLSQSPKMTAFAFAFGTIGTGFGINAILRPASALTLFELDLPAAPDDRRIVESLMVIYGVGDIFMGLATYATATYGSRKALGWIVIATGAVAFADGLVCYGHGRGHWNHWSYVPVTTGIGSLFLGCFD